MLGCLQTSSILKNIENRHTQITLASMYLSDYFLNCCYPSNYSIVINQVRRVSLIDVHVINTSDELSSILYSDISHQPLTFRQSEENFHCFGSFQIQNGAIRRKYRQFSVYFSFLCLTANAMKIQGKVQETQCCTDVASVFKIWLEKLCKIHRKL